MSRFLVYKHETCLYEAVLLGCTPVTVQVLLGFAPVCVHWFTIVLLSWSQTATSNPVHRSYLSSLSNILGVLSVNIVFHIVKNASV